MADKATDWIELYQLKTAYSWNYDTPDLEALIDLFTDDAVCVFGSYGIWEGKAAIRDGYAANIKDDCFPGLHVFVNPSIQIDGDRATGKWYLLDTFIDEGPEKPIIRIVGYYDERYRREPAGWRIERSELHFLWNSDTGRQPVASAG